MIEKVNGVACPCQCLVIELCMIDASNAKSNASVVAVPPANVGIIDSKEDVSQAIVNYAKMA